MGHPARLSRLAGRRRPHLARGRAGDPRRHGGDEGPPTAPSPTVAPWRSVPSGAGAHLGLGGAALRAAVARELGRRRLRRPAPLRPLVATSRRVAHPAEPARRADADASLSALPVLRIDAAVPQRRLPSGRRRAGRGGPPTLSAARR